MAASVQTHNGATHAALLATTASANSNGAGPANVLRLQVSTPASVMVVLWLIISSAVGWATALKACAQTLCGRITAAMAASHA